MTFQRLRSRSLVAAIAVASLAATLFASRESHAQEREPAPASAPAPKTLEWYGWQTLLVDAASIGLLYVGARTDSTPLVVGSAITYSLGAPAVHLAHDRPAAMGIDVALRIGLPFAFAGMGYAVGDKSHPPCTGFICFSFSQADDFAAIGFLAGIGTAVVIDAAVLAREPSHAPPKDATRAPKLQWTPTAGVTRGGATAGVIGSF